MNEFEKHNSLYENELENLNTGNRCRSGTERSSIQDRYNNEVARSDVRDRYGIKPECLDAKDRYPTKTSKISLEALAEHEDFENAPADEGYYAQENLKMSNRLEYRRETLGFEQYVPEQFIETNANDKQFGTKNNKSKKAMMVAVAASFIGGTLFGLGTVLGAVGSGLFQDNNASKENPQNVSVVSINEPAEFVFGNNSKPVIARSAGTYAEIFERVNPSVVNIVSNVLTRSGSGSDRMQTIPNGLGSGVIFHEDNEKVYIATNYHVIRNANSVQILISGNEKGVSASLVGKEEEADLAVISILKADLAKIGIHEVSVALFGDSDLTGVGEEVLAIGNALGEGNSVTNGIISAKDKIINVEDKTLDVIQTNAQINKGNSGGALVNMNGEVIGINTAKIISSYREPVEGVGYSIASNIAKPILENLMNNAVSDARRPILGITGGNITENVANMYNLPILGIHVADIMENSGADKAGMQVGDIIVGLNGEPCLRIEQLQEELSNFEVGDKVSVHIIRGGVNQIVLNVTLLSDNSSNF